jgi:hypothetical protein
MTGSGKVTGSYFFNFLENKDMRRGERERSELEERKTKEGKQERKKKKEIKNEMKGESKSRLLN